MNDQIEHPPVTCLACGDDALHGGDYCRWHQAIEDKAREEEEKERAGYRGPWVED